MLGFRQSRFAPGDAFLAQIARGACGSVILFDRDVLPAAGAISPRPSSCGSLRPPERLRPAPVDSHLDPEGGRVRRLKPQRAADLPSAQSMGAGQPDKTRALARQLGKELANAGISTKSGPGGRRSNNPANPAIGALERFSPQSTGCGHFNLWSG